MKSFQSPLSTLEEKQYLEQLKNGSEQAKSVLIERNLRLVAHIARKYQGTQEDMEDLISIGTVGLIKAVSTYNLEKGSRLGTYAARCIENAILSQMRLWFLNNPSRAEKNPNGVFWHRFPRISTSFDLLRTAM